MWQHAYVATEARPIAGSSPSVDSWLVLIPMKTLAYAKSRLDLPDPQRRHLARAFYYDVLEAVSECARVATIAVVTADPQLLLDAHRHGAIAIKEPTMSAFDLDFDHLDSDEASQMNQALSAALDKLKSEHGHTHVAIVTGDLPCARAEDLDAVLERALHHSFAFVRDENGQGTTMVMSTTSRKLPAVFGPMSAERFVKLGAVDLSDEVPPRIRTDVDTLGDLAQAVALGVGPHTREAVETCPDVEVSHPE